MPVILDDTGNVMESAAGIRAARKALELTAGALAELLGVDVRTVNGWEAGRPIGDAAPLNMLGKLLENRKKQTARKKDNP